MTIQGLEAYCAIPPLSTREGVKTDATRVNLFTMPLVKTKYAQTKFEMAKEKFPPGKKWTADELSTVLQIARTTAERWILRWVAAGWVRKMETGEDTGVPGAAKFRYAFRAAPRIVLKFGELD